MGEQTIFTLDEPKEGRSVFDYDAIASFPSFDFDLWLSRRTDIKWILVRDEYGSLACKLDVKLISQIQFWLHNTAIEKLGGGVEEFYHGALEVYRALMDSAVFLDANINVFIISHNW